MTKFIVQYNLLKERVDDAKFMKQLKQAVDSRAGKRKFDKLVSGYEGDDFVTNHITVQYHYWQQ